MEHWNEVRSAYAVARLGTVSAAATELGVHRATIIRHINTLEASLGARLFQRHARGYTPTAAGLDLARVARTTREQLDQLAVRARGHESAVTGELIVTSIEMVSPLVTRAIARSLSHRAPSSDGSLHRQRPHPAARLWRGSPRGARRKQT